MINQSPTLSCTVYLWMRTISRELLITFAKGVENFSDQSVTAGFSTVAKSSALSSTIRLITLFSSPLN